VRASPASGAPGGAFWHGQLPQAYPGREVPGFTHLEHTADELVGGRIAGAVHIDVARRVHNP
jgi:hypothetical protein